MGARELFRPLNGPLHRKGNHLTDKIKGENGLSNPGTTKRGGDAGWKKKSQAGKVLEDRAKSFEQKEKARITSLQKENRKAAVLQGKNLLTLSTQQASLSRGGGKKKKG